MKKRNRLKNLAAVVCVLILAVLALYLNGNSQLKYEGSPSELSSWMAKLDDAAPLNKIAIPGSHDAGTAGLCWLGETQTYSIGQQLSSGARYFDLRVHKDGDRLVIYHSIFDGADFADVLSDIREFILTNPTETLLLDFQHFKGDSQEAVRELLESELLDSGLVVRNDTELSELQFIRALTLGDVRGKCLIFFGDEYDGSEDWIFSRNDDECALGDCCLDSYYIGSIHKSSPEKLISKGHPIYFARQKERSAAGADGLFVLQCQLTDGMLIFGPWTRERAQDEKMSAYIGSLGSTGDIDTVNVILRDFITPDKCRQIIDLNVQKGYIAD